MCNCATPHSEGLPVSKVGPFIFTTVFAHVNVEGEFGYRQNAQNRSENNEVDGFNVGRQQISDPALHGGEADAKDNH